MMPRYIDAFKLYDEIESLTVHIAGSNLFTKHAKESVLDCIEQAKTEDVQEVKHGHWFFTEYDFFDCSVCGEAYYNGCNSTEEAKERLKKRYDLYKYCPNCGARMDAEEATE